MLRSGYWARLVKRLSSAGVNFALQHPRLLRAVATLVRFFGIWCSKFVVRYSDAVEILGRETDFTSAEGYAPSILTGPFLLGLDRAPLYESDKALLHQVVRPADLEVVRQSLRAFLATVTSDLKGQFDLVNDVAARAATHVITDYFGVPACAELKLWLRRLAAYIVAGRFADDDTTTLAYAAADGLRAHVRLAVTAATAAKSPLPDTVLARLLAETGGATKPEDKALVVRNVCGLLWVSHAVIVQAITLAMDELLRHPDGFAAARIAAKEDKVGIVASWTFEALRFNPVFPILPRYCPRDTVVVDRSGASHAIAANTKVLVWPIGAMFDPDGLAGFENPAEFRGNRPACRSMVFGHGVHQCFGEHIARVELPEMMMALLKLNDLRRPDVGSGAIVYEGPAVAAFFLEYGP